MIAPVVAVCSQAVSVAYATANGTATAGQHYTATSGTLTIAAGTTSGTISVPVLNDALFEANERFTVTLSNPTSPGDAQPRDGHGHDRGHAAAD